MIRSRSAYTCIGDSTGDLRHFDMAVRCAAHYAGATLRPAGGVNHPDSDLAEVVKVSSDTAIG